MTKAINPFDLVVASKVAEAQVETAAQKLDNVERCPACGKKMERVTAAKIPCNACMQCRVCLPAENVNLNLTR